MKKIYESPEFEVLKCDMVDVLLGSIEGGISENIPDPTGESTNLGDW